MSRQHDDERARRNAVLGIDLLREQGSSRVAEGGGIDGARTESDIPRARESQDNRTPSAQYGALQAVVDELFEDKPAAYSVRRLDVVLAAEASDLPADLLEVVGLLPPGDYSRARLCTQLNSAITGHAWGQVYGTVV